MTASLQSPADIVNDALTRIGYADRVGSLYEGSKAAKKALDIYGQTRDQMLRDGEWPFARRDVVATLNKSAPVGGYVPPTIWDTLVNPPLPWLYEYLFPSDCLKVRAVRPTPIFVPNYSPQPHLFEVSNNGNERVILSNVANAIVTYAAQITDPTDMAVDFVEALCASLARRLAPVLANMDAVKLEAQDEQVESSMAERQQG